MELVHPVHGAETRPVCAALTWRPPPWTQRLLESDSGPGAPTSLMSSLPSLIFSVAPTTNWWILSISASCGGQQQQINVTVLLPQVSVTIETAAAACEGWGLYTHEPTSPHSTWEVGNTPIYQRETSGSEKLSNFPRDTQLPSGRTGTGWGPVLLAPLPAAFLSTHRTGRDKHTGTRSERLPHARAFKVHVALKQNTLASRWRFGLQNFSPNTWKAYMWAPGLTRKHLANNPPCTPTLPSKG